MSRLFRAEVIDSRRDAWRGRARLVQPRSIRLSGLASLLLVAGCLAYLIGGTYTRRVQADGVLMPHAGLITVASPVAGLVRSTAATEGARVHKGDLLYEINLDATSSDGPTQARIIAELRQQRDALRQERRLKVATAAVEKQALVNEQHNLIAQHAQLADEIATAEQSIPTLRDRIEELRAATRRGLALQGEYQNQTFLYLQTLSQVGTFRQDYLQLEGRIADTSAKLAAFDDRLAQALNDIDRDALKIEQQITEGEARRAIRVTAPEDGVLTAIRVRAGQTVAAGATLLTLLQSKGQLEADLYVDSTAIGFVRKGAHVLLRYAAFPYQRFGLYEGTVAEVTRAPVTAPGTGDAHQPPLPAAASAHGGALYRIVAVPRLPYVLVDGKPQRLEAGMEVQANIALDRRPLYRWLLDPLYRVRRSLTVISEG